MNISQLHCKLWVMSICLSKECIINYNVNQNHKPGFICGKANLVRCQEYWFLVMWNDNSVYFLLFSLIYKIFIDMTDWWSFQTTLTIIVANIIQEEYTNLWCIIHFTDILIKFSIISFIMHQGNVMWFILIINYCQFTSKPRLSFSLSTLHFFSFLFVETNKVCDRQISIEE